MPVKVIISFLAIFPVLFVSCKKTTTTPADTGTTFKFVIDDGPVSALLGKRVSLTGATTYRWGKNSTELITKSNNKLYRLDLANAQYELVLDNDMLITGRDH